MCTLTFLPSNNTYIFTSNRDEHESRSATLFPVIDERNNIEIYFPQDPKAGGTWLATSNTQKLTVLLNGAFKKHSYSPPYRKSRGIVLLDVYNYESLYSFSKEYDLENIEAFTIVEFDLNKPDRLLEFRWDGKKGFIKELDAKVPHIWSSAQLYSADVRKRREKWFSELLQSDLDAEKLIRFHEFGGAKDDKNKINMNWGFGLRTISISQLIIKNDSSKFEYKNLVNNTDAVHWIKPKSPGNG